MHLTKLREGQKRIKLMHNKTVMHIEKYDFLVPKTHETRKQHCSAPKTGKNLGEKREMYGNLPLECAISMNQSFLPFACCPRIQKNHSASDALSSV